MHKFERKEYFDQTFIDLVVENSIIETIHFENCKFKNCKFLEVKFKNVRFTDCDFQACDLSLSKFKGCHFSEVSFKDSNLAGINWTELHWPLVKLASQLYFYSSNVSHSSFFGLELSHFIIENCKVHNVDFREANLSHASFINSDLNASLFLHTNLKSADFTNAVNYNIDPSTNNLIRARFSYPEVVSLLNHFNIIINE